MYDALPGFHAFTGSDYTSAFVRKGKVRPFAFLKKDTVAQKAFAQMSSEKLNDQSVDILKPQGYMEHHQVERVLSINTTIRSSRKDVDQKHQPNINLRNKKALLRA